MTGLGQGRQRANPGAHLELGLGAAARLGSTSTTEKARCRPTVSSSW